jgi:hypothetical protein
MDSEFFGFPPQKDQILAITPTAVQKLCDVRGQCRWLFYYYALRNCNNLVGDGARHLPGSFQENYNVAVWWRTLLFVV